MKSSPKIATVIVTYNRKDLLVKCLKAVEAQSLLPTKIYIVDNASTDGTEEVIQKSKFIIPIEYIKLKKNIGGAGGFYTGIKNSYESNNYDGIWVMDDDGIPDKDCLKILSQYLDHGFVGPLVLDIANPNNVAFPYLEEKLYKDIVKKFSATGFIRNYANPFNGILFSKKFIEKVGYPNKDMFIWGDEVEYQKRAIYNGYNPITIISALHYHPKDRLVMYNDFLGKKSIVYVDSKLRRYCKYRNTTYSLKKYSSSLSLIKYIIKYTFFFIITRKFDLNGFSLFMRAFIHGWKEDLCHHKEYMN